MGTDPAKDSRVRRRWITLAIYLGVTAVVLGFAARGTLSRPTPNNHFALLAEAFLAGRTDLGGEPPHNNDFALHSGRYFVVFPPFPALLILPWVAVFGGAAKTPDGLFFGLVSGAGPALLFLVLEKLRERGESERSELENVALALLFAFGSVYFFSAVQGTVWFAAHVVGVALAALYVLFSIGAERPFAAGICLGLGFATRAPLAFAAPLFLFEALRAPGGRVQKVGWFAGPVAGIGGALLLFNAVRFGDPFEFGYRYLTVVWHARIERWGLFSYHYLARNLAVLLASLPWAPRAGSAPFLINGHGLALWFTTPLYFLLLWPKRRPRVHGALGVAALGVALPSLFYQNTGWLQFGQRFSNDYAVFLFALLAVGGWSLRRRGVVGLALAGVLVNGFGAWTFGRPEYRRFYFYEPTQTVLFQPD